MPYRRLPARARPRHAVGFTLVEVAVSLFIIVVGILPVFTLLLSSRRVDQQAQVQAAAYNVARQEMETLCAQTFTPLRTDVNVGVTSSNLRTFPITPAIAKEFPYVTFSGTYSIVDVSGTYGSSTHPVQQVIVRVTWTNAAAPGAAPPKSYVQMDTLVAKQKGFS